MINGFVTDRLSARHWREWLKESGRRAALVDRLCQFVSPRVLEFLPKHMQTEQSPEAISAWIDIVDQEGDILAVRKTESGRIIGLFLVMSDFADPASIPTVRIGYMLAEEAWGQGYASELVTGLINEIKKGPPVLLLAGVMRENQASARVLTKCGFQKIEEQSSPNGDYFRLEVGSGTRR